VRPKAIWADLICHTLTNTTTASDCQTLSSQISGDETEQGIDDYGGKDAVLNCSLQMDQNA